MKEYIVQAFDKQDPIELHPFYAKDVQELVRCKDCKYWWYGDYCEKHGKGQEDAYWFCADGERRTEV